MVSIPSGPRIPSTRWRAISRVEGNARFQFHLDPASHPHDKSEVQAGLSQNCFNFIWTPHPIHTVLEGGWMYVTPEVSIPSGPRIPSTLLMAISCSMDFMRFQFHLDPASHPHSTIFRWAWQAVLFAILRGALFVCILCSFYHIAYVGKVISTSL